MPVREDYHRIAQAILAEAEVIREPGGRAVMLSIAQLYLRLAYRVGHAKAHRDTGVQRPQPRPVQDILGHV